MAFSQKQVVGQVSYDKGVSGGREELEDANLYREVGRGKNATTVLNFSVATQQRKRDSDGNWEDDNPLWTRCEAWGRLADNIADSVRRGDRLVLIGEEKVDKGYEKEDGTKVPDRPKLRINEVGLSLFFDTAESHRDASKGGGSKKSSSSPSRKRRSDEGDEEEDEKPAPKKNARQKKSDDDDFDLDSLDLNLDDDEETPF